MKCKGIAARAASCSGWGITGGRGEGTGLLGFFLVLNIVTAGKGFSPKDDAVSLHLPQEKEAEVRAAVVAVKGLAPVAVHGRV